MQMPKSIGRAVEAGAKSKTLMTDVAIPALLRGTYDPPNTRK